jgi:hypothetical protein
MDTFKQYIREAVEEELAKNYYLNEVFLDELSDWINMGSTDDAIIEAVSEWFDNTDFMYNIVSKIAKHIVIRSMHTVLEFK